MQVNHGASSFETSETVVLAPAHSRILKREIGSADVNRDEDVIEDANRVGFDTSALAKCVRMCVYVCA